MASVGWAAARHKGATQLLGRRASTARVLCFCGCGQPAAQRGAWGCMTQACMWRLAFDTTPRCCDVVDELPDSEICIGARMCVRFRGGMRAPLFDFIRPDLLCMECRQDGCRVTVFLRGDRLGRRRLAVCCRPLPVDVVRRVCLYCVTFAWDARSRRHPVSKSSSSEVAHRSGPLASEPFQDRAAYSSDARKMRRS